MSRKDTVRYNINEGVPQSLSASFVSPITTIKFLDNVSYQINITTTDSTGTFAVQASNDYCPAGPAEPPSNPGNWISLTLAGGVPSVAAMNDNIIINLNQLPFTAIRLAYTSTIAGTGTCDMWLVAKQLA